MKFLRYASEKNALFKAIKRILGNFSKKCFRYVLDLDWEVVLH